MPDSPEQTRLDRIADDVAATRATVEYIRGDLAAGRARFDEHDSRLRSLETSNARIRAIGAIIALVIGGALTWILNHLRWGA